MKIIHVNTQSSYSDGMQFVPLSVPGINGVWLKKGESIAILTKNETASPLSTTSKPSKATNKP